MTVEATVEKIGNKTLDIMGSLSRLWLAVGKVTKHTGEDEPARLSVESAQMLVEKTVSLVGQLRKYIYERRKNVLAGVSNPNMASSSLKDDSGVLLKGNNLLFGMSLETKYLIHPRPKVSL